jgi:very-short-patch-repair endonuclease
MHAFHSDVLALFGRQHGVASADQLQAAGLTKFQISTMVRKRQLIVVHRAVYRLASSPITFESLCAAASLTDHELAVSHQSAARLWGLRQMTTAVTHVTVASDRRPIADASVRLHRSRAFRVDELAIRDDGIRLTKPARTLFDLSATVGKDRLETAVEHALRLGIVTIAELTGIAADLRTRGRPGLRQFVDLIESRPVNQQPVDSDYELLLDRALNAAGLPAARRQFPIRLLTGDEIHPDLAWPALRWAIEVDHGEWHDGASPTRYDNERDRQLRLLGWEVERVSDSEIRDNLAAVVRDLTELYRNRVRSVAS